MKIYDTDPEVYARTTNIKPERSKSEIDGVLARFGVKDVAWRWDLKNNDVFLMFKLPPERFGHLPDLELSVKLEPPRIWHKTGKGDVINWKASIRNLYWYILTHLSQAYVMQSGKATEFLPHILSRDGRKIVDLVGDELLALPDTVTQRVIP